MPTTKRLLLINAAPDAIRGRLALMESRLIASEELQGTLHFINLIGRLRAEGVEEVSFVPASRFDADYARYASRSGVGENEIQQLAIDLIARAYTSGATDIHLAHMGTHVRSRFRVLGLLRDDQEYDADTGARMIRAIYEHLGAAQDAPAFDVNSRLDGGIINRDYLPQGLYSVRIHSEPIECDGAPDGKGTFMPLRLLRDTTGARCNVSIGCSPSFNPVKLEVANNSKLDGKKGEQPQECQTYGTRSRRNGAAAWDKSGCRGGR